MLLYWWSDKFILCLKWDFSSIYADDTDLQNEGLLRNQKVGEEDHRYNLKTCVSKLFFLIWPKIRLNKSPSMNDYSTNEKWNNSIIPSTCIYGQLITLEHITEFQFSLHHSISHILLCTKIFHTDIANFELATLPIHQYKESSESHLRRWVRNSTYCYVSNNNTIPVSVQHILSFGIP